MTVFLQTPKHRTYRYDFEWRGQRYTGSTHQRTKADAELVEARLKLQLRQLAGGVAAFDPKDTPSFSQWAGVYLTYQAQFVNRTDVLERTLRVVLEFWGRRPLQPTGAPAVKSTRPKVDPPYHDLRLGDPIADPSWILKFQRWMDARGISGSTRNSYLSALSGLYKVALQPEFRAEARISENPFRDIRRSSTKGRIVALTRDQVIDWIREASYHVALAVTIGALAPKLRLQSILDLEWDAHLDLGLTRITLPRHKTAGRTGAPQVTPISELLREVLKDARARYPESASVISFRGRRPHSIKRGARRAVEKIGLTWGIEGVTFHTLRHSIATLLAEMGLPEAVRKELMGHTEIRTTQQYTHLSALAQEAPHEALAVQLRDARDVLLAKPRPSVGKSVGTGSRRLIEFRAKSTTSERRKREAS